MTPSCVDLREEWWVEECFFSYIYMTIFKCLNFPESHLQFVLEALDVLLYSSTYISCHRHLQIYIPPAAFTCPSVSHCLLWPFPSCDPSRATFAHQTPNQAKLKSVLWAELQTGHKMADKFYSSPSISRETGTGCLFLIILVRRWVKASKNAVKSLLIWEWVFRDWSLFSVAADLWLISRAPRKLF